MTKWFKKWFWPTVRVGLPILIVAGGIVFVIFAIIHKLIDVDSARYLLSAIVQALATLLAIIFAGVAILWNREHDAFRKLEKIRTENYGKLRRMVTYDSKKIPLIEAIRRALAKTIIEDQEEWSGIFNETKLLDSFERLSSLAYWTRPGNGYPTNKDIDLIELECEKIAKIYKIGDCRSVLKYDAVEMAKIIGDHDGFIKFIDDIHMLSLYTLRVIRTTSIDVSPLKKCLSIWNTMVKDEIYYLTKSYRRGREARGPWFKVLISLYSITIAGGMVFLSILKKGVLDLHATWFAAGPLLFAVWAVALTFYYLARIVSGEKDA